MDPEPVTFDFSNLVALAPALAAAAYATITAAMASLSPARRTALKDSLPAERQGALERYLKSPERIEARWLWLRVSGVAATAALLTSGWRGAHHSWLFGFGAAIFIYAVPSELARPFATRRAEQWISPLLRILRPLEWLVAPLSDPLSLLAQKLAAKEPKRIPSTTLTETEVELIVNEGEQNGSLAHDQSEMIRNVLDFGDLTAEDVMVPRIHVDALDANMPMDDVLRFVVTTQHSRYPVYRDSIDNVIGVLHVKDLFARVSEKKDLHDLTELCRNPVAFVPEGQQALMVLTDMRLGRHHLAVVSDEFGGCSVIVTLEDLLEEIVGDIQDEYDLDDASSRIVRLDEGRVLVDASLPVTDVNRHLGTDFPEGDYVSLAGLLLDRIGRVPATGSEHELLGISVTIREADTRHISRVELGGLPEKPEPDSKRSAA